MILTACYDKAESKLLVSVKDTGVGISKEDSKGLFKQFGKLEQSDDLNPEGIGLGLHICA